MADVLPSRQLVFCTVCKPQPATQREERVRGRSRGLEDVAGEGENSHLLELWLHPLLAKPLMS